ERHLKHSDRSIEEEPPVKPERDETLWCGPTGNAVRDFNGKSAFAMTNERARAIRTPDDPANLRALLGIRQPAQLPRLDVRGSTKYRDCDVRAVEVNTAAKVWAPAWLFLPKKEWSRLLLILEPNGRNGRWHEDDLYSRLAGA